VIAVVTNGLQKSNSLAVAKGDHSHTIYRRPVVSKRCPPVCEYSTVQRQRIRHRFPHPFLTTLHTPTALFEAHAAQVAARRRTDTAAGGWNRPGDWTARTTINTPGVLGYAALFQQCAGCGASARGVFFVALATPTSLHSHCASDPVTLSYLPHTPPQSASPSHRCQPNVRE
jgi:hypothetical protein